ncbi:hypothetical protein [Proteiniphilum saccharofermentans]|uniref:hypothetical protein n=1 Tax=Proteiniphilum saccharofermentans TaxID=1642647 RepID=UPI0028AFB8A0|nr:hypothetical protein [Proteiniphilum saccharofermentans]
MKTIILILLVSAISCMNVHSQTVIHSSKSDERIISSEKIEYLNMEVGWAQEKKVWYYYGNRIMVTPVSYTLIETTDSTYMSNGKEIKIRIEIREESSGSYQTSEDGWKWNNGIWIFSGDTVRSYPPSFTKKGHVRKKRIDNDGRKTIQTAEIEEFYRIDSEKWTWSSDRRIWLYDNIDVHKLPKYKIIKSRIVTHTN